MTEEIDLNSKLDTLASIIVTLNGEMILLKAKVDEMQDQLDAVYIKPNLVSHDKGTI